MSEFKTEKRFRAASILMLMCVLFVASAPVVSATPVNKVTYSSYTISNVQGTRFCTVYFSNGMTAYNTYNLKASRDTLNSRVLAFSKNYGLGITSSQIASRTNICYANRVSYKAKGTVTVNYP